MGGAGGRTLGPGRPRCWAGDSPLLAEAGKRGAAPFAAAAEGAAPAPPAGAARTAAPPRGGRLHGQALRGTVVAGLAGREAPGHQVGEAAAVSAERGSGSWWWEAPPSLGSLLLRRPPAPISHGSRRVICRRLCPSLSGRLWGCAEGRALAGAPRSLAAAVPRAPPSAGQRGWGPSRTFITRCRSFRVYT